MILNSGDRTDESAGTFDALFRRAGVRRADAVALADAPNRADRAPRKLTYGEADRAISGLATRLRALGLMTDSIVAIQLGNTVESVIALLGVLRAGMIAVPLPVLWRQRDMTDALGPLGPKAIITATRIGDCPHAEIAMRVAAELFPVRYICAFGNSVPDGVVPLDDLFADAPADLSALPRRDNPGAHVAVVTLEASAEGPLAVARSQDELMAGGSTVYFECGAPQDMVTLSTIPVSSFGGLCATLVTWLLSGGTLHLHHGFDANAFLVQRKAANPDTVIVPGPASAALADAGQFAGADRVVALWRAPERMTGGAPWSDEASLIDVAVFGETAIVASKRGANGAPCPIPLGVVRLPRTPNGTRVLETVRTRTGMLALRGPMVPTAAFPPGIEDSASAVFAADEAGFVDTRFMCRKGNDGQTLVITGAAGGLATIGGYSFSPADVEAHLAKVDAHATFVAVPDALLGQRLAGQGRERTGAFLQAFGFNALVSGAFNKRKPAA